MEERIIKFVSALRAAGVRVSLAESTDAFEAIDHLGIQDREAFRLSLRSTLIKTASHLPKFDDLFPLFFGFAQLPPLMDLTKDLTPEEAQMLAEAIKQFKDYLQQILDRLTKGQQLSDQELDQLGQLIGLNRVEDLRYREWMARRMEQALRFREVRKALEKLMELLDQMGMNRQRIEQIRQLLQANRRALEEQLRQYAGERIAENLSNQPLENGDEGLLNRPFGSLSDKELDYLRKEVQRLATALRTRVALRQKRAKTGLLDAKATIRTNLKHGNVPMVIKHKDRSLKPKIVIICDVSTSVRPCSELMLSLLYAVQDLISKTYAFAFINHLEFISPNFMGKDCRQAVADVLEKMPSGHYNTDLGFSLDNFTNNYMDTIDRRVSFILVGDGRNNYNDPRLDLLQEISRRSHQTIWLNPESPGLWGSGDSDMLKYAPLCDQVSHVGNLADITTAVDQLLG